MDKFYSIDSKISNENNKFKDVDKFIEVNRITNNSEVKFIDKDLNVLFKLSV